MSGQTSIEWTRDAAGRAGASWNPVTGCSKVSPGCAHCYAEAFAERFRGVPGHPYERGFDLKLWPERLELPLRWRRPRLVFVNSMSDLSVGVTSPCRLLNGWPPNSCGGGDEARSCATGGGHGHTPDYSVSPVDFGDESAVRFAGGAELLVTFLQRLLEVEDLLLELVDSRLEAGGVGGRSESAALDRPGPRKAAVSDVPDTRASDVANGVWPRALQQSATARAPKQNDLFHEEVPDEFVGRVFEVMERASWHTFQVLTKRHRRLAELAPHLPWPANVWMGVSIENRRFVHRADQLRQVPAALRFISAEPLLGPLQGLDLKAIDWLIAGGESGHGARPLDLAWVRDLVARCRAANVAVFVKQLGARWAGRGKGNQPSAWPADLRLREMPAHPRGPAPEGV